jgi:hypothetical protein
MPAAARPILGVAQNEIYIGELRVPPPRGIPKLLTRFDRINAAKMFRRPCCAGAEICSSFDKVEEIEAVLEK